MGRIIVTVVLVVVFAVFVALNAGFTTSVNLFGSRFDDVQVVSVAALSFAAGVVCSLFIYLGRSLHRREKRRLTDRDRDRAEHEKTLARRQEAADVPEGSAERGRTFLERLRDFFIYRP